MLTNISELLSIINLIAMLLVGITAWYARSSEKVFKEIQKHSRILAFSAAVSVEAGITALPPAGQQSAAADGAFYQLERC